MVVSHLKLIIEYMKINIATAMEYRFNFIVQSLSMVANNAIWILFWWIFFQKFNIVNTWTMNDMIGLYAVLTFSFGIAGTVFGNRRRIAEVISEGRLDFFLTLPKNVLFHTLIGKSSWFAFGDVIFGLIMATIAFQWWQFPLYFLLCTLSAIILTSFAVIVSSLAFYMGDARSTSRQLDIGLMSFGGYPLSIFSDTAKILLMTVIPAGFISTIPVELLTQFQLKWFLILLGFTLLIFVIAIFVFYRGLRKYESGSMITTRM
jgi:ABC-2 type transport system permease protein